MVIWVKPAKTDLKAIHDFIASNSKYYAKKVIDDIVEKPENIYVLGIIHGKRDFTETNLYRVKEPE
jgi:hypothetical protein